jgi:hypothetical protein
VRIELRGNQVAILEGLSERLNSKSVLETLLTGPSPKN